jgi:heme A synthase
MLLTGYILSRGGKPYGNLLVTVHKLLSLGVFVYLIVTIVRLQRLAPLSHIEWVVCLVCGFLFLVLIATGGLMSAMKNAPEFVHKIHQIVPYLVILASSTILYQLLVHKIF